MAGRLTVPTNHKSYLHLACGRVPISCPGAFNNIMVDLREGNAVPGGWRHCLYAVMRGSGWSEYSNVSVNDFV